MPEQDSILTEIISKLGDETNVPSEPESNNFYSQLTREREQTESLADKENREIIEMRKKWANWILIFIGVIIIFDIILVTFYGLGVWDFKDTGVVIAIVTENFLKIISLGVLVTINTFKKIF